MTGKVRRTVLILWLVAALSAVLVPASGHGETLRFVFMADGRGNAITDIIDKPVLNAINSKILGLSPRPSFVIFGGDQAYRGCINGTYSFQEFKNVLAPLTNAGIKLYTVLGNHELYQHPGSGIFSRQPTGIPKGLS